MKILHLIPILFLAAFCTVSAQTNNALANSSKSPSRNAIDFIQVGKDTTWTNGYILHIDKRDDSKNDSKIEGIRLVRKTKDGQHETVISDFGFIQIIDPNDTNTVGLTMLDPEIQIGN